MYLAIARIHAEAGYRRMLAWREAFAGLVGMAFAIGFILFIAATFFN